MRSMIIYEFIFYVYILTINNIYVYIDSEMKQNNNFSTINGI